jgi:hypothetical protein
MSTTVPEAAIQLIQEFEGCERSCSSDELIHAYPDPGSGGAPWTIGWGTTVYPDGRAVAAGDAISQEEADKFFIITLQEQYWQPISITIPYWQEMNQPMRSSLCSFAYNVGADFYGLDGFDTISRCLRQKCWQEVPQALMLYVNPGSSVEAGLRRRRQAEGQLWREGLAALGQDDSQGIPVTPVTAKELLYEAISDTFLKKEKVDSSLLLPQHLVPVESGRQYKASAILQQQGNSIQVRLAYGAGDWWLYQPHWRTIAFSQPAPEHPDGGATAQASEEAPEPIKPAPADWLNVPYFSQLDNCNNPMGSCNVTCAAMGLAFLGMEYTTGPQLEDQLYEKMEVMGWDRHDPNDLKALIESFPGYKDSFRTNGTFKDIQVSIDSGRPVIIHGYFTSSGHIIVIKGYDNSGVIVNDPYGEYFSTGYDNSRSGAGLHYSYNLIARTCSPESCSNPTNLWIHSLFRL